MTPVKSFRCLRVLLLFGAFILVACVTSIQSHSSTASKNASLSGHWESVFTDESKADQAIELDIIKESDHYTGTWKILDWGMEATPLDSIQEQANKIIFNFSKNNLVFRGERQGNVLRGSLHAGYSKDIKDVTPVILRRKDPQIKKYYIPRDIQGGTELSKPTAGKYWKTATPSDVNIGEIPLEMLISDTLNEMESAKSMARSGDSLLIAKNGKLVVEEYFFANSINKLHMLQSCTKSITSVLAGIVQYQHSFPHLNTPAYTLFPDYKNSLWVKNKLPISISNLLNMNAGIDWNEKIPYSNPKNSNTQMNNSSDWIDYILNQDLVQKPGSEFSYTSGLTILLGEVISRSVDMPLVEFAEQSLFDPLEIDNFIWGSSKKGRVHTGGGLSLRPRDFLKIGQLMLNGGIWNGKRLLSKNWIDSSFKPHASNEKINYSHLGG